MVFTLSGINLKAQTTITGTVIQQPCNDDGKLAVSVTGLTLPINFHYYINGLQIDHNNVNSMSDIITNIPANNFFGNNYTYIYVVANPSVGQGSAQSSFTLALPFNYTVNATQAICPALGSLQVNVTGGSSPYSYLFTNAETMQSYNSNSVSVGPGDYKISVTDAAGCVVRQDCVGVYYQSPVNVTSSVTPANCLNGAVSLFPSGGIAPYSYLWANGATTQNISGLVQGVYQCTVTDVQGCYTEVYEYVQQTTTLNFNSSITNATCLQNNGSFIGFMSGGTPPYSYSWSNGGNTLSMSGLAGNFYSGIATDANGCTGNLGVSIGMSTPINVTYTTTPSSCTVASGSAGLAISGGTPPYTVVWNTFPTMAGATISNITSGVYPFEITDAVGCVQHGSVYIPPVSTINAAIFGGAVLCPATTGNLLANVSGTNPPFIYAWNNGTTTAQLNGAPFGNYSCIITDAVGCSVTKYKSVVQTSDINLGVHSTPASCVYSNDGAASVVATGGLAPYTYNWSNTQSGPSVTGLLPGNYYITVTDANGCHNDYSSNNHVYVGYNATANSCYCTISGTLYNDANNNCIKDAGEHGIGGIMMHCNGQGYAFTDTAGVYHFNVPTGTYTITESINPTYPLASCQTASTVVSVIAAPNCTTTVNFANTVVPIHDLHIITTSINHAIPGNSYYQRVVVVNEGTLNENNVQLGYAHEGQLSFYTSGFIPFAQQDATSYPNWYSVTSNFPHLAVGNSVSTIVNYSVPTNIPLNTQVNFFDSVAHAAPITTTWLTDNTPWNNVNSYQETVVGSFDPNFKEVYPKGLGASGDIFAPDSVLNYTIHFQNEGTYFAQNIYVLDTLDSDLDWSTLDPGYSDHGYKTTVSENGVVRFDFKNINLPWKSTYGDLMSSGMVSYSIKLKRNLAVGTQIKNGAAIYFDYNSPVITNKTLNTIAAPLSVKDIKGIEANDVVIYPNPAQSAFTISIDMPESYNALLSLFDISGREVSARNISLQNGKNSIVENIVSLQSGIYFVQLKTNNSVITKKLVIAK